MLFRSGKNGAGKTTTMKAILGLLKSDSGEIYVMGEKVHFGQTNTNRFIGYLPDVPEFYSYMTQMEYLSLCGEVCGMDKTDIVTRSKELLELVGLGQEHHRIKGFSRGMKQRLGIAQALLNRPKLLICDEPTSALDPAGRKEILDILLAAKEQTTVLFLHTSFRMWSVSVPKSPFCTMVKLLCKELLQNCETSGYLTDLSLK